MQNPAKYETMAQAARNKATGSRQQTGGGGLLLRLPQLLATCSLPSYLSLPSADVVCIMSDDDAGSFADCWLLLLLLGLLLLLRPVLLLLLLLPLTAFSWIVYLTFSCFAAVEMRCRRKFYVLQYPVNRLKSSSDSWKQGIFFLLVGNVQCWEYANVNSIKT